MKKIYFLFLFIYTLSFGQNDNSEYLYQKKIELNEKIKLLNDSIQIINNKIAQLESVQIKKKASDSSLTSFASKGSYLKKIPHVLGDVILKTDKRKEIVITDFFNNYLEVCLDSICGYMSELWIEENDDLKLFVKNKKLEIQERKYELIRKKNESIKIEKEKQDKIFEKKYGKSTYNKLKEGYYWIGMSKEMARISLGYPNDINRTVNSWGEREQWVYKNKYLYFKNGILTSYQD